MIQLCGLDQVVSALGDPRDYIGPDGVMSPGEMQRWEARLGLVYVSMPGTVQLSWGRDGQSARVIRCPELVAESYRHVFALLHERGIWYRDVHDFGGCLCVRSQRGAEHLPSLHSWGLAIDINVLANPRGQVGHQSEALIRTFEDAGFLWGGGFHTPDPMHWQIPRGC